MQLIKYGLILLLITANTAFAKPIPPGAGRTADLPVNVMLLAGSTHYMWWQHIRDLGDAEEADFFAIDTNNNFYIDHYRKFAKYTHGGNFLVDYENTSDTENNNARIWNISADSNNNIYAIASDSPPNRVKVFKYDDSGNLLETYRDSDYNFAGDVHINTYDIYVDNNDNVWVLTKHRVTKLSPTGVKLLQKDIEFIAPQYTYGGEIAVDNNGFVYVANKGQRLNKYDVNLNLIKEITTRQSVGDNNSLEINSNNELYLLTTNLHGRKSLIRKYDSNLNELFSREFNPGEPIGIADPIRSIVIDDNDTIYAISNGAKIAHSLFTLDEDFDLKTTVVTPTYTTFSQIIELVDKIALDSRLNKEAHFGLYGFANTGYKIVDISPSGSSEIHTLLDKPYIPLDVTDSFGDQFNFGMQKVQSYLLGPNSPITDNCQRTIVVVIGAYHDFQTMPRPTQKEVIENLYNNHDIKTYIIDVMRLESPSETNPDEVKRLAIAGGTNPPGGFYGYDYFVRQKKYDYIVDEVYKWIESNIQGNTELRYTFTNPVIITNELGEEHIYHAVFDYQSDGQWQGRLRKFKAEVDGGVGALEWDAGEVLDATPPDSRKIWTKSNSLPNSYNNFSVANVNNLKTLLGYSSNSSATSFIRFVRGYDSYDENQNGSTIDSRWKLGDIYHSQLVLQEAPNGFISPDEGHFEGYYRHTHNYQDFINAHKNRNSTVFVGANDGMLHAFSAQSGEELWGFVPPNIINAIKEMDESGIASNSSESIFAVDGRIALKDIYTGGRWKSVLMVGLGQGGKGYFALDVTDETAPEFMFAFLNDVDAEKVYYWDNSGAKTEYTYASVPAQFDYSKLGLATSKPHIINIKQGSSRKWVAIVGGGENDGVRNTYAQGLLVLDLENDGKVLENISLIDRTNDIINAVPNQLTLISGDTTNVANYKGYMGYITDYEGKTWKLDLTDNGTMFETTILHDVEATKTNGRYGSNKLTPSISKELNLWNYFGTGDKVNIESPSQNKILGLKDDEFPIFNIAEIPNASLKNAAIGCPATSEKGWYWDLGDDAKVTGKVAIVEGLVYVPVYTPDPSSECRTGYASIRIYDMSCGELIDDIDVVRGVPGDIIAHKDKLYMSVSKREEKGELPIKNSDGDEIGEVEENIAVIQAITSNNKKLQIKNWKEVR
jgi:hypothetical protein